MESNRQRGFSMLELMIVIAIGFTVTSIAVVTLVPTMTQNDTSTAYDTTLMALRNYQNLSVTNRIRYIVTFTNQVVPGYCNPACGVITVQQWNYAVPVSPAPFVINTIYLPHDVSFQTQAGFPTGAANVPDGFGAGIVAIDFDQGEGLGSQTYVMFMPDGSSQDVLGNWNSGVLYLGQTNNLYSSRALTVFGPTGRIRGWRLYLQGGANTWVQQ
ncbi:MAG: type II secretion system protein [Candidatus Sulfotelmatobacter sp.]|jgi:prepilin-type N-terminal cleavage/methylation domain-containing protein